MSMFLTALKTEGHFDLCTEVEGSICEIQGSSMNITEKGKHGKFSVHTHTHLSLIHI